MSSAPDPGESARAKSVAALVRARGVVIRGEGAFRVGPVDFTVNKGEALAIVGRAGSGKSLLLSGLVGLAPLEAGDVDVEGVPLRQATLAEVRRRVGFCFQRDALLDDETALENVRLAVRARATLLGWHADEVERRSRHALQDVGLDAAADKLPAELSGGMKKRLGIARAIACEPALLLGDAVTAGLDPSTAAEVLSRLFARVRSSEMAAIIATHDVDAVLPRVDRVLVLEQGRVLYAGSPEGLSSSKSLEPFAPRRAA